jgi:hypothetical protein
MKKGLKEHKGSQAPNAVGSLPLLTPQSVELDEGVVLSAKTTFEGDELCVFLRRCAAEHMVSIILSTLLIVKRTIPAAWPAVVVSFFFRYVPRAYVLPRPCQTGRLFEKRSVFMSTPSASGRDLCFFRRPSIIFNTYDDSATLFQRPQFCRYAGTCLGCSARAWRICYDTSGKFIPT